MIPTHAPATSLLVADFEIPSKRIHWVQDSSVENCTIPNKQPKKLMFQGVKFLQTSKLMFSCRSCGFRFNSTIRSRTNSSGLGIHLHSFFLTVHTTTNLERLHLRAAVAICNGSRPPLNHILLDCFAAVIFGGHKGHGNLIPCLYGERNHLRLGGLMSFHRYCIWRRCHGIRSVEQTIGWNHLRFERSTGTQKVHRVPIY